MISSHAFKQVGWQLASAFSLLLAFSAAVHAADPDVFSNKKGAIRGADAVAYWSLEPGEKAVYGNDAFTHEYQGATWKFATAENRDMFAADPAKYAPQFGGYCAFAVSHNFTKPVNPDAWRIVDDKLYLNLSKKVQRKWAKDLEGSINRGHSNWPNVLTKCEKRNNCRKSA